MGGKTKTRIKKILGSYRYLLTNMTKLKLKILLLKQTSRILIVKGLSAIEWIISNFNSVESLNLKNVKNVIDSNNHLAFLVINGYFTDNRKDQKVQFKVIRWFCTAYLSLYITRWSPWKRSSEETLLKWSWSKRDIIRFSVAVVSGLDETQCVGNVHNKLAVGVLMSSTSWPARPSTLVFLFRITLILIQAPSLSHGALTMIFL